MHPHTPGKRMSVFTAIALGISAIAITCIVSASLIALYGMHIVDQKADTLIGTAQMLLEELPALRDALPPALADVLNDERRPGYVEHLKIEVDARPYPTRPDLTETSITVVNDGDEVISTLALRVVVLDETGRPISANTEYVATPLAIDNDWRGPLMPGSTRRATNMQYCPRGAGSVEYEVTELRVWKPEEAAPTAPTLATNTH